MATVVIVGSGMMGSALAFPARENGHEVHLVGTNLDRDIIDTCKKTGRHPKFTRDFPSGVTYHQIEELDEVLRGADLVIGGVSSFGVDWFGEHVLPRIPDEIPILTVTKGLLDTDDGRLLTYPEVWEERMRKIGKSPRINSVGGPCTSYELVAHDQTEVSFCGRDIETLREIKKIMQTDYYHVSITTDVIGVESAVALKNGYALAVALTIGLNQREFGEDSELHFNSQAAVFGQSVREMYKLLAIQGAAELDNLCVGVGDLYVTIYGGRTRLVGILLGRGLTIDEAVAELSGVTLESLVVAVRVARAIKIMEREGRVDPRQFPLLMHVAEILSEKKEVKIPWESFTYETE